MLVMTQSAVVSRWLWMRRTSTPHQVDGSKAKDTKQKKKPTGPTTARTPQVCMGENIPI